MKIPDYIVSRPFLNEWEEVCMTYERTVTCCGNCMYSERIEKSRRFRCSKNAGEYWYYEDFCSKGIKSQKKIQDTFKELPSAEPLTETDYIELTDRFGAFMAFVVRDMIEGKGERWKK